MIEVAERVGADGELVRPLDEGAADRALRPAYADGFRAAAVVFMHGYRYPEHEQRVGRDRHGGSGSPRSVSRTRSAR